MKLLEMVMDKMSPEVVSRLAGSDACAGAAPSSITKAIGVAAPTILAAFGQTASSPGGASRIFAAVAQGGGSSLLGPLASLTGSDTSNLADSGQRLLTGVLGDRSGGILDTVTRASGLGGAATNQIAGLVTSVIGGVLGGEIAKKGLDARGLGDLLTRGTKSITTDVTAHETVQELRHPTVEEVDVVEPAPRPVVRTEPARAPRPVSPKRGTGWVPAALLGLLLVGGLYAFARNRPAKVETNVPRVVEELELTSEEVQLPGGKVAVDAKSAEGDIAKYLASDDKEIPKRFTAGGLNFEFDSTQLTPDSMARVNGLANVLKAAPASKVRVEGHTDAVGDAATNEALSLGRALEVRRLLEERGIASDRIAVDGKGATAPLAPNDTAENRAKNRRIDVIVVSR